MNISESVDAIMEDGDLIGGHFYDLFFEEFPDSKRFFAGVDMKRQAAVLTSALVLVESIYTKSSLALIPYLKHLGKVHQDRDIYPQDYSNWLTAMLKTLAKFHGQDWSSSLEQEWRNALQNAINVMLSSYEV